MRLQQLFEARGDSIAFCFGRMNPPTVGHKAVFDTLAKTNKNYKIFVSPAQKPLKDNPLDFATKVKFIKEMFPEHSAHVSDDPSLNTIMAIAGTLYQEGYRHITMIAGSDRLQSFKELLEKYNGYESAHGMYKFDTMNFVSSGDRDPDAEGVAGISASSARDAARNGDIDTFRQVTGAGKFADELYKAVRAGLKIKESIEDEAILVNNPEKGVEIRPDGGMGTWNEETLVSSLSRQLQDLVGMLKYGNYENVEHLLYTNGAMEAKVKALAQLNRFKQKQGRRAIAKGREINIGKY
jgi:hypothetical protein